MPSLLDQLLLPQRLASRVVEDVRRIADAAAVLATLATQMRPRVAGVAATIEHATDTLDLIRTDLERLRAALEPMSEDLDRIRTTFAATSEELEKLREAVTPELIGVREATDQVNTGVRDQVQSVRELDGIVQTMGERLEARLTALHDLFVPLIKDAGEVREVVEPLQGATERMGRIADRLPGPGRKQ